VVCIAPRRECTSKSLRYGMCSQGISQFTNVYTNVYTYANVTTYLSVVSLDTRN